MKPSRGAEKAVVKMEAQIEAAGGERVVDVYEARSIDDALDLLSLTSSSSASASKETLERHPERRMKAAYTQYEERELPLLKVLFYFFPSFFLVLVGHYQHFLRFQFTPAEREPFLETHTAEGDSLEAMAERFVNLWPFFPLCWLIHFSFSRCLSPAPENPMNQQHADYNVSGDDAKAIVKDQKDARLESMRLSSSGSDI